MTSTPFLKSIISHESLFILMAWVFIMFFGLNFDSLNEFLLGVIFLIPSGWLLYQLTFHFFFPQAIAMRFSFLYYFMCMSFYSFLAFSSTMMIMAIVYQHVDEDFIFSVAGINVVGLFFLQNPIQWFILKRLTRNNEKLFALQKQLGKTEANVDFLRSQINPHFLFNALNTLYGLALQEKAERTGEGIQKLGDMMRFMLQENVKEKITLQQEFDYLNNYISLQKLRTEANSQLKIQIHFPSELEPGLLIAPMLLVPFVENAFKHGISFREDSQIKVSLELKDKDIYFDVHNTKHERPENDPERNNSGIGLPNVKQRLQLLYPDKHELVIRETPHDYFVHLIINLG
jgi:sensor histidine kinase YesM